MKIALVFMIAITMTVIPLPLTDLLWAGEAEKPENPVENPPEEKPEAPVEPAEEVARITPEADLSEYKGRKVEFTGKYREMMGRIVMVAEGPVKTKIPKKAEDIFKMAFTLETMKDNIHVTGKVVEDPDEGFVILADKMEKAPTDMEVFDEAVEKTGAGNLEELEKIAVRARAKSIKFEDLDLQKKSTDLLKQVLENHVKKAGQEPGDLVEAARKFIEYFGDKPRAIELCRKAAEIKPGFEPAEGLLIELECVKRNGQWLTRSEYMRKEGLVEYNGKWMSTEKKYFLEKVDERVLDKKEIDSPSEDFIKLMIKKEKVIEGMKPEHVAATIGFPVEKFKHSQAGKAYVMWLYEDGSKIFFENGLVFHIEVR